MEKGKTQKEKLYNFIKKTRSIINQYERFKIEPKENYDVTLLLNACVGLLFIAHEKYKDRFGDIKKLPIYNNWNHYVSCVEKCKCKKSKKVKDNTKYYIKDENPTIKVVCKHIRNSIAHCNFETKTNDSGEIVSIIFKDFVKIDGKVQSTFKMSVSLDDFKGFAMAISDYIIWLGK